MKKYCASCCCGQLKLICEGDPIRTSICHCFACQQRTGSVFGVQARFELNRVAIDGKTSQYVRVAEDGDRITFNFCPTCASTVYWQIESIADYCVIAVGAFANPQFLPPTFSVYEDRKHSWVSLPPNMERWN